MAGGGQSHTYAGLTELADKAPALVSVIPADESRSLRLGGMPPRIQTWCWENGQPVPETKGEIIRCVFESLALEDCWVAKRLDEMVEHRVQTIHVLGGGSQNRVLNQVTAEATSQSVMAGPIEASAGNVLVQATSLEHVGDLSGGRARLRRPSGVETHEPTSRDAWDEADRRYLQLRNLAGGP